MDRYLSLGSDPHPLCGLTREGCPISANYPPLRSDDEQGAVRGQVILCSNTLDHPDHHIDLCAQCDAAEPVSRIAGDVYRIRYHLSAQCVEQRVNAGVQCPDPGGIAG